MLILDEPCEGIQVVALDRCVEIRSIKSMDNLNFSRPLNSLGKRLEVSLRQIEDLGLGSWSESGFVIQNKDFVELPGEGVDCFESIAPDFPLPLQIRSTGSFGLKGFQLKWWFLNGKHKVIQGRCGAFFSWRNENFFLGRERFLLCEEIEEFNRDSEILSDWRDAYRKAGELKSLLEKTKASVDEYFGSLDFVVPQRIKVDVLSEPGDSISFVPEIDGIDREQLRRTFFLLNEIPSVVPVSGVKGRQQFVILSETQKEVFKGIQRVRHLRGPNRVRVLCDPLSVFDGVANEVDISGLGPRIKGIGDFPFLSKPYIERADNGFLESPEGEGSPLPRGKYKAGIEVTDIDGVTERIEFDSMSEILDFKENVNRNWKNGTWILEIGGKTISLTPEFVDQVNQLAETIAPSGSASSTRPAQRQFLIIKTNEEVVEFEEPGGSVLNTTPNNFALPEAIRPDLLKKHQLDGYDWLQRHYHSLNQGCLLADEMGLGKSLQTLAFLAWLIENDLLKPRKSQDYSAEHDPILVVTPLILLENETWISDIRKFFKNGEDLFRFEKLHSKTVVKYRKESGAETKIGTPVLDLIELRKNRVIFTNYETVVNYQHSFARVPWSVIVTDEAQEYKTPTTRISFALKSLTAAFKIACTGTPVETRLLDVWNIFDFLKPGNVLGSAREFTSIYEKPIQQQDGQFEKLEALKSRLRFGKSDAFLLRREKNDVLELPEKREVIIDCELSPEQEESHREIVRSVQTKGAPGQVLKALQQLIRVYQHPALYPEYQPYQSPVDAIKDCPKLEGVLGVLTEISKKREKVLVFTRFIDVQHLLATTFEFFFKLKVEIINGATKKQGKDNRLTRSQILKDFGEKEGFNILILSPEVAGTGLTIVEANHVIHYGRWWNPAREAQATDRVYRIGQDKPVTVYHPIARVPDGGFESFDEKLHRLIERRKELARNFLMPLADEAEVAKEIGQDLFGFPDQTPTSNRITIDFVREMTWDKFETLCALLESKQNRQVFLTPKGGDRGADVFSRHGRGIRFIQCKHFSTENTVPSDIDAHLISSLDYYRARIFPHPTPHVELVLMTNAVVDVQTHTVCQRALVEVIDRSELKRLLDEFPCTTDEIESLEQDRLLSLQELKAKLFEI